MLFWVNGLHRAHPVPMAELAQRFSEIKFVPFYYHYYVPEAHALISAATPVLMYAPVGVLLALATSWRPWGRSGTTAAAMIAAALALVVEAAKLFIDKRPDPTDLLLAAGSGACAYFATSWVTHFRPLVGSATGGYTPRRSGATRFAFGASVVLGISALLVGAWGVLRQPRAGASLAVGLVAYAMLLAKHPGAWLVVLPALLLVLDFAQWTGRLYFDEFDLFVLVTIGPLAFLPKRGRGLQGSSALVLVGGLWLVSTAVAFANAFHPLPALTPDTFWSLHSPAAALRVVWATLWAVLLVALVNRWSDGGDVDIDRFAQGMTLGLAALGVAAVYERLAYASLALGDDYRAVAMFSAASTAGAQIESFLAAATPFAIFLLARARQSWWRAVALAAIVLSVYAAAATVSRTAIFGITLGALVAIGSVLRTPVAPVARLPRSGLVALFFLIGIAVLVAASSATLARFVTASPDLQRRLAHWQGILSKDAGLDELGFGRGLGGYPAWFQWHGMAEKLPPPFSCRASGAETFLRVPSGRGLHLDQIVDAVPGQHYIVEAMVRRQCSDHRDCALPQVDSIRRRVLARNARGAGSERLVCRIRQLVAPSMDNAFARPITKISLLGVVDGTIDLTQVRLLDGTGP